MKTVRVSAVLGVNPGYSGDSDHSKTWEERRKYIVSQYQLSSKQEGLQYPAVFTPNVTVYPKEWGCPNNGENTFEVSLTLNEYYDDIDTKSWVDNCKRLIKRFAHNIDQHTVLINVYEGPEDMGSEYIRLKRDGE